MNRVWWRSVGAVGILLVAGLASGRPASGAGEMTAVSNDRAPGYTFTVDGQSVNGLYPGQTRYIKLRLTNPFTFPLLVRAVHADAVRTSRALCTPNQRNLIIRAYAGQLPERIPPRSSKTVDSLPVYMPTTAARDCASTVFTIHLTATAERARR